MARWHLWLNGHEVKQPPGDGDGQGSLACCSPWSHKQSDTTEWLRTKNLFNIYFYTSIFILLTCQFLKIYVKNFQSSCRYLVFSRVLISSAASVFKMAWGERCFVFCKVYGVFWGGFLGGSVVKNLPAMLKTRIQSLGEEDPLEEEMATHYSEYSTLAGKMRWTEEPNGLQSMGSQRVRHNQAHTCAGSLRKSAFVALHTQFSIIPRLYQTFSLFSFSVFCSLSFYILSLTLICSWFSNMLGHRARASLRVSTISVPSWSFTFEYNACCKVFLYGFYHIDVISFYSCFVECLIMKVRISSHALCALIKTIM